jgi:hypothetical protein
VTALNGCRTSKKEKRRSGLLISNRQFVPLSDPRYEMKRTAHMRDVRSRDTNSAVGGKLEAHNRSEHKKLIISHSEKSVKNNLLAYNQNKPPF